MTREQIEAVVRYLTLPTRLGHHSVALQVGGKMREEAEAFFALRDKLGITGYATAEEVLGRISERDLKHGAR